MGKSIPLWPSRNGGRFACPLLQPSILARGWAHSTGTSYFEVLCTDWLSSLGRNCIRASHRVERLPSPHHVKKTIFVDEPPDYFQHIDQYYNAYRESPRAACRIPSHRAPSANRDKPNPQALPHENICTQHRCREIKILVLFDETTESQEI
jgi:hypothetical protein